MSQVPIELSPHTREWGRRDSSNDPNRCTLSKITLRNSKANTSQNRLDLSSN